MARKKRTARTSKPLDESAHTVPASLNEVPHQGRRRPWAVPFSPEVNAALVAIVFTSLAFIVGRIDYHFGLIDSFIRSFGMRTIELVADSEYSGSGYRGQELFSTIVEPTATVGFGDAVISGSTITSGVEAKLIVVFSFFDFPEYEEIESVEVRIPCAVAGNPTLYGRPHIRMMPFSPYDSEEFDAFTSDYHPFVYYDVSYRSVESFLNECQASKEIILDDRELTEDIRDLARNSGVVQFVLWFSAVNPNGNGSTDAVIVPSLPVMRIKYLPKR